MKLLFLHSRQKIYQTTLCYKGKKPEERPTDQTCHAIFLFFRNKIVLTCRNLSLFEQGTMSKISSNDNENRQCADNQCP